MIRPAAGKTYADTIRSVRSCGLTMEELGMSLVMRETQDGSLLMKLSKGEKSTVAAKRIASAFSAGRTSAPRLTLIPGADRTSSSCGN